MPQYETHQNRVDENLAIDCVRQYLRGQPFVGGNRVIVKETDTFCGFDFDVFYRGLRVGIGEVKARRKTDRHNYDKAFFLEHGWDIEREKMVKLYKIAEGVLDVMFVLCTSDGYVQYIMLDRLQELIKKGHVQLVNGTMRTHQDGEPKDTPAYRVDWAWTTSAGMTI